MLRLGLALSFSLTLAATAYADDIRTKSWFLDHAGARDAVVRICRDNPGGARHSDNCINAEAAAEASAIRRQVTTADREFIRTCATISAANRRAFGCL